MKKLYYLIVIVLISSLVLTGCSLLSNVGQVPVIEQTKVKPTGNLAGAEEVAWNLSADVMPDPPYGSGDIPGSDTLSKLIVNQPNGNVEVAVTGVMKGLDPTTVYTVFPSKAWISEKWNITDDWSLKFLLGNGIYDHDMTVTFQDMHTGEFLGTGHSTTQTPEKVWDIQGTSNVSGDTITLDLIYTGENAGYTIYAVGTIGPSAEMIGTIISGNWTNGSGTQSGTWSSTLGEATKETVVENGWPGLFPGQAPFTFTTDEFGEGSWHFNLKNDDFDGPGDYTLSVWINNGTILISDNFTVEVD